uniref:PA domain-containing protein n=1 Tax=Macrostomum lignano TaxID=282301 RepID=A0A1I8JS70_9PLAT
MGIVLHPGSGPAAGPGQLRQDHPAAPAHLPLRPRLFQNLQIRRGASGRRVRRGRSGGSGGRDSSRIQPTFGCVGAQIRLPCGGPALAVVEVGGRRLYRDFWPLHCAGAEAVLFVVDSNDSAR